MTPAEELTAAADRLDALTTENSTTPWEVRFQCPIDPKTDEPVVDHHHDWDEVWVAGPHGETVACLNERYTLSLQDGAYIAAMDPRVGRQLALLMRVSAEALVTVPTDEQRDVVYDKPGYVPHPLLSIARMINGGDE